MSVVVDSALGFRARNYSLNIVLYRPMYDLVPTVEVRYAVCTTAETAVQKHESC